MRLRYFSMAKVATRVWLFVILASFAMPVMHIMFPYIDTSQYYHVEQMFNKIVQQQNATLNETIGISEALSSQDMTLRQKFDALLTLTPIGLSLRFLGMVLEGIATGLYPIWMMLGFDKIRTANGISLAVILSSALWVFYVWTIFSIVTGRDE